MSGGVAALACDQRFISRKQENQPTVLERNFSFTSTPTLGKNPVFTLDAENLINRLIASRWICLAVAALFFLSGRCVNADPVGDFFKKVGQSISKAFQPQPTPSPGRKTRASKRGTSQESIVPQATPTLLAETSPPAQKEKLPPVVLRAAAVPPERAKGDMPYGIPVPGHKGMVTSPYVPEGNYIDVSGFAPGSAVKDPYTGKIFLVP